MVEKRGDEKERNSEHSGVSHFSGVYILPISPYFSLTTPWPLSYIQHDIKLKTEKNAPTLLAT
jgi:hypothetical protein